MNLPKLNPNINKNYRPNYSQPYPYYNVHNQKKPFTEKNIDETIDTLKKWLLIFSVVIVVITTLIMLIKVLL